MTITSSSSFLMDFLSFLFILVLILIIPSPVHSSHKNLHDGPLITVRKHLFFPNFTSSFSNTNREDINLLGSAIISTEKGCIQIPDTTQENDIKHQAGRAIYSSPIRLFDFLTHTPASFESTFSFQFKYPGNSSSSADGGSGLSFIIVPDEFTVGRPGPWLATLNDVCDEDSKSIAIEFDTHQNPEFGDPNDNHIGINLGSIVSTQVINVSEAGIYLKDGTIHQASISYDGEKKMISITLETKLLYSGFLDLSPFLNEYMFVGFSASTGNNFTQIHNVLSWNFTSISKAHLHLPSAETCQSKIMMDRKGNPTGAHGKTPTSFLIFISVVVFVFIVMLSFCFIKGRKKEESTETLDLTEKKQRPTPPNKARRFTVSEITTATRRFSEIQILGDDTRSVTYKGTLLNGSNVAVKRFLTQFFSSHGIEKKRMHKEIKSMSKIRHPNMVTMRGWCFSNHETIVVYDYIPNGSLDKWLFGVGVLPWTRRFKVVKDVAESLSFLHSKQLAHKNVKTSSVFLDVSFRAVLGDFGFVLPSAGSTRFESVVSQTADVFEFGLLVLEVVAGRVKKSNPGEMDLLDLGWAMHEKNEIFKLVDRRMGKIVIMEQAIRVLEVGLLCTLNENKGRPTMEEVVEFLHLENPIPELPTSRPISLFPYSSTTGLCTGYNCALLK